MKTDPPTSLPPPKKEEPHPVDMSPHSNRLFSSARVVFPPMPPSTPVGNWILTGHSFAPQREYYMRYCTGLAKRRVVDHLLMFEFPKTGLQKPNKIPVHYSRLTWVGGPLAQLIVPPLKRKTDETKTVSKDDTLTNDSRNPLGLDVDINKARVNVDADVNTDAVQTDDVLSDVFQSPTPKVAALVPNNDHHDQDPGDDHDLEPYVREFPFVLPEHVSRRTFAIVVKFLYCEEICFNYLTFDEIVALATTAHRWALTDLYNAAFAYVMDQDLLAGGLGIRTFLPLVNHPETPESFRRYFCIAVGHHFDVLYPRLSAQLRTENSLGIGKSERPLLWDVIIRQKMLSHVVHCIRLYSAQSYDLYLLNIILRYFEPSEEADDDEVIGLLSQLDWDHIDPNVVFQRDGMCKSWSSRALRLAALASYAPHTESLEVRIPWNIPLQRLLKAEAWSFQTEHVFCGPYICYLHVRKNNSPEVSLFVHIWNRDGKPIMDDTRHERVRVMCRATEMNCSCDSRKQWSDSPHGFLENLKFEGRLQRYPGLGWSQFLEARRLDEWRASHGEDCGLAITTVLQFLKPRKQFEGPAPRTSARSSSPMKVTSPIQKKRPVLKMKLRESR